MVPTWRFLRLWTPNGLHIPAEADRRFHARARLIPPFVWCLVETTRDSLIGTIASHPDALDGSALARLELPDALRLPFETWVPANVIGQFDVVREQRGTHFNVVEESAPEPPLGLA